MLSVVPEGNFDEEAGSHSFRKNQILSAKKLSGKRERPNFSIYQTKQITVEDEQDQYLMEGSFSFEASK